MNELEICMPREARQTDLLLILLNYLKSGIRFVLTSYIYLFIYLFENECVIFSSNVVAKLTTSHFYFVKFKK